MAILPRARTLLDILQQAHYDRAVFCSWLTRHPVAADWDAFSTSAVPIWSLKARLLLAGSLLLSFGQSRLAPGALLVTLSLLKPFEELGIWWICLRARRKFAACCPRAVIGITGSYGKTTTKEIVVQVLSQKFHVCKTPENVNTLLGVAKWVLANKFASEDAVVVEMGAYHRGDIAALASLVRPGIGILTGLNEAHLERFGSLGETARTKCELIDALKSGGIAVWNADSPLLRDAVAKREQAWKQQGIRVIAYGMTGAEESCLECGDAGESGTIIKRWNKRTPDRVQSCRVPMFGRHMCEPISAALVVAKHLGMSDEEISRGLAGLKPLPRRLSVLLAPEDRLIVDDSYNITLAGFEAACSVLAQISRRKIGVFAGIPEAGERSAALNQELGRRIAEVFDVILLRDTPVSKYIIAGLREKGFEGAHMIRYTESKEIEPLLAGLVKKGDCIYFSAYDWPAVYL
ncbi:MAG: UDP-N-acetylmuramoyl-tripeptide--D-alanyl-D-alanine ligase [Candidatus Sungbacteria bacterium]|nr:UDP-N-acetylmuramoyl-tripeptide--D-alanyl-D-alanine ligase [Candidatus Sungbacteria bacterium]